MLRINAITRRIISKRKRIEDLARTQGFRNVRVFGSIARGDSIRSSDVDILVDAMPGTSYFDLARLERDLTKLLKRKVDVLTSGGIHPFTKDSILVDAIALEEFVERYKVKRKRKAAKLGSRIAARFAERGLAKQLPELRGQAPRPARLGK